LIEQCSLSHCAFALGHVRLLPVPSGGLPRMGLTCAIYEQFSRSLESRFELQTERSIYARSVGAVSLIPKTQKGKTYSLAVTKWSVLQLLAPDSPPQNEAKQT